MATEQELNEAIEAREQARLAAYGARVSYLFMAAHPEFKSCPENSKILSEYIIEHYNGQWNQAVLEEAYGQLKDELVSGEAPPPIVVEKLPWPEFRTIGDIKRMEPSVYKQFFHSKKHGAAFQAAVQDVLDKGI